MNKITSLQNWLEKIGYYKFMDYADSREVLDKIWNIFLFSIFGILMISLTIKIIKSIKDSINGKLERKDYSREKD